MQFVILTAIGPTPERHQKEIEKIIESVPVCVSCQDMSDPRDDDHIDEIIKEFQPADLSFRLLNGEFPWWAPPDVDALSVHEDKLIELLLG